MPLIRAVGTQYVLKIKPQESYIGHPNQWLVLKIWTFFLILVHPLLTPSGTTSSHKPFTL